MQHVDRLNGFQVADTQRRRVIATLTHTTPLKGLVQIGALGRLGFNGFARSHSISIRPDQSEIWSVCGDTVTIHALLAPDFSELASIELPGNGYWITFSPDSRFAFIALSEGDEVAMIETQTRQLVRTLRAGQRPKRNLVLSRVSGLDRPESTSD